MLRRNGLRCISILGTLRRLGVELPLAYRSSLRAEVDTRFLRVILPDVQDLRVPYTRNRHTRFSGINYSFSPSIDTKQLDAEFWPECRDSECWEVYLRNRREQTSLPKLTGFFLAI